MSSLKGKTALVTGSTSGIGLGMAIALAKQGVNIMVNGFGEKDEAIAKIKACGVEVDYHGADRASLPRSRTSLSKLRNVLAR